MAGKRGSTMRRQTKLGPTSGSVVSGLKGGGVRGAPIEIVWSFHLRGPAAVVPKGQYNRGGFATRDAALDALDIDLDDVKARADRFADGGPEVEAPKTKKMTFGELEEIWRTALMEKPKTQQKARSYRPVMANRVLPWFADVAADEVPDLLEDHYEYLLHHGSHMHGRKKLCPEPKTCEIGGSLSPGTVGNVDIALRSMYTYATKTLRLFVGNPMAYVPRPELAPLPDLETWTFDMIVQALEAVRDSDFAIAFAVVLLAGLRPGEMTGLRWSQINWNTKNITVNNQITYIPGIGTVEKGPKYGSIRKVAISDTLYRLLKEHKKKQAAQAKKYGWTPDYVLCQELTGKPFAANYLTSKWLKCLEANGLPRIVVHKGRHCFASACVLAGVSVDEVGLILGHKPGSRATARYVHPTVGGHARAISMMDQALQKSKNATTPDNADEEGPERQVA